MTKSLFPIIFLGILLLISCKKDAQPAPVTSSDIFKKHSWYPKQYQVAGNDTITVYVNGSVTSQSIVPFDSSHVFEDCIQQSKYDFINNDTFLLHDNCETFVPLLSRWSLENTGGKEVFNFQMLLYGITNLQNVRYFIGVNFFYATLDSIDDTRFVFTSNQKTNGNAYGVGPNYESIDTLHRSGFTMTTTFVSK